MIKGKGYCGGLMKYKVLFCMILLLAATAPVACQERPGWAEVGSHVGYKVEMQQIEENLTRIGSGTMSMTVKEVYENYAAVEIKRDMTWNPEPPPGHEPLENDNWYYQANLYFLPLDDLENLKAGVVPERLENDYRGIQSISTAYGEVKCFYFFVYYEFTGGYQRSNLYYDCNTGILVKFSHEATYPLLTKTTMEILGTNIPVAKERPTELPWLWISIGIVGAAVVVLVALWHRRVVR
jgi:hypothetical protein